MSELQVFSNGNDYIVAYSIVDAMAIWNDTTGDDFIADDYGDEGDWGAESPQSLIKIRQPDDDPAETGVPDGATVDGWVVSATAEQWATYNGRGWLCSHDF